MNEPDVTADPLPGDVVVGKNDRKVEVWVPDKRSSRQGDHDSVSLGEMGIGHVVARCEPQGWERCCLVVSAVGVGYVPTRVLAIVMTPGDRS